MHEIHRAILEKLPAEFGEQTITGNLVKEGDVVTKNMPLMTIEAMKMETTVVSTVNGTVDKIYVEAGDSVHQDDLLVSFHIKE